MSALGSNAASPAAPQPTSRMRSLGLWIDHPPVELVAPAPRPPRQRLGDPRQQTPVGTGIDLSAVVIRGRIQATHVSRHRLRTPGAHRPPKYATNRRAALDGAERAALGLGELVEDLVEDALPQPVLGLGPDRNLGAPALLAQ